MFLFSYLDVHKACLCSYCHRQGSMANINNIGDRGHHWMHAWMHRTILIVMDYICFFKGSSLLARALQSVGCVPIRLIGLKEEHSVEGLLGFKITVIIAKLKEDGRVPFRRNLSYIFKRLARGFPETFYEIQLVSRRALPLLKL